MQMEVSPGSLDTVSKRFLGAALAEAERRNPEAGEWTSARLAKALKVDEGTVSRWRSGTTKVSRMKWMAILLVLGLETDWTPAKGAPTKTATPGRRKKPRPDA